MLPLGNPVLGQEGVGSNAVATPPLAKPLHAWVLDGVRTALFMAPRLRGRRPTWWQWLLGVLLAWGVWALAAWAAVPGTLVWSWSAWWQSSWPVLPVLCIAVWAVMGHDRAVAAPAGHAVPAAADPPSAALPVESAIAPSAQQAEFADTVPHNMGIDAASADVYNPIRTPVPHGVPDGVSHPQPQPVDGATPPASRWSGVGVWLLWLSWGYLPPLLLAHAMAAAVRLDWIDGGVYRWLGETLFWSLWAVPVLWCLSVWVVLVSRCARSSLRAGLTAAAAAIALTWTFSQEPASPWILAPVDRAQDAQDDVPPPPRMVLTQAVFEQQQALLNKALAAVPAQRPGVADVYGLVFAPYSEENVFLRESTMVRSVLQDRFDAQNRVLHLMNHATTTSTLPWATPANLQAAIARLASVMDKDEDMVFIYMTSHGAKNFELAAAHRPLTVEPVTPQMLKTWLDDAGIRHRIVAVSACYSGGWVPVLADDDSLIMTAADATHTSYGCGRLSELTFFGRAVFDEQLRTTHSLTKAFEQAVPLIRQREIDAGKPDGFSNPQIHVGRKIVPLLTALEQRLDAADAAPTAKPSEPVNATHDATPDAAATNPPIPTNP